MIYYLFISKRYIPTNTINTIGETHHGKNKEIKSYFRVANKIGEFRFNLALPWF